MSKSSSIIEINGNRYDAVSGQLIGSVKKVASRVIPGNPTLSIDGFRRAKPSSAKQPAKNLQRKPERSKTLMRSTVKKPAKTKLTSKIQTRTLSSNPARATRAKQVHQHAKVQRFGVLNMSRPRKSQVATGEVISSSAKNSGGMSMALAMPSAQNVSHQKLERLLDYALAHADAHKRSLEDSQRQHRKLLSRYPRWLTFGVLLIVLAVAIGFLVWHRLPEASLRLAATKAHVPASLPTFPQGYKIRATKIENGSVVTEAVNSQSDLITVIQKVVAKPSQSLAADSVPGNVPIQSFQNNGNTTVNYKDPKTGKNVALGSCHGTNNEAASASLSPSDLSQTLDSLCD